MTHYGKRYRQLRLEVLARNDGMCAFCGVEEAKETHHGQQIYPSDAELRADHLVQLCLSCHELATSLRKWIWRFGATPATVVDAMRSPEFTHRMVQLLNSEVHVSAGTTAETRPMQIQEVHDVKTGHLRVVHVREMKN